MVFAVDSIPAILACPTSSSSCSARTPSPSWACGRCTSCSTACRTSSATCNYRPRRASSAFVGVKMLVSFFAGCTVRPGPSLAGHFPTFLSLGTIFGIALVDKREASASLVADKRRRGRRHGRRRARVAARPPPRRPPRPGRRDVDRRRRRRPDRATARVTWAIGPITGRGGRCQQRRWYRPPHDPPRPTAAAPRADRCADGHRRRGRRSGSARRPTSSRSSPPTRS